MKYIKVITCGLVTGLLASCSTITNNDGDTVVIDHVPMASEREIAELAERACKDVGKQKAIFLRSASRAPGMDFLLPNRLSTFRCH